ncbi:MAG: tetratricopeptide repeat protein [Spirosomataceae bacterium]
MFKSIFLLFFTFMWVGSYAQTQELLRPKNKVRRYSDVLQGTWYLAKVDMKDGSRALSSELNQDMIMAFDSLKHATVVSPNGKYVYDYQFSPKDSTIVIATELFYKLVYVNSDELVIHDQLIGKKDYDLTRFHFIKSQKPLSQLINEKFVYPYMRAGLTDTVFQMNQFVCPKYKAEQMQLSVFEEVYGQSYAEIEEFFTFKKPKNGRFRVSFVVNKQGELQDIRVNSSTDRSLNEKIISAIQNTAGRWIAAELDNHPVKCLVRYEYAYGKQFDRQRLNEGEVQDLFMEGIDKYIKKNYQGAIEIFTKVIEADPNYIKAYFNRGASYQMLNQFDKACKDWNYLVSLGQKWVQPYVDRYCANASKAEK